VIFYIIISVTCKCNECNLIGVEERKTFSEIQGLQIFNSEV